MEWPPCEALRPWVAGYTFPEAAGSADAYPVLPGLQPVLGVQYRGRLSLVQPRGDVLLDTAGITGLQGEARRFRALPGAATLLVRFHPWGAAAFLPAPMHELADRSLGLSSLLPPAGVRAMEERLAESGTPLRRIRAVEDFLLSLLRPRLPDRSLREAARRLQADPVLELPELAERVGLGERQLERKFREWIGVGPRRFARLARFRQVLHRLERDPRTFASALDLGFYDQAHFIKDFRAFTGTTPRAWLRALPRR